MIRNIAKSRTQERGYMEEGMKTFGFLNIREIVA
jgi:hypothetical protein